MLTHISNTERIYLSDNGLTGTPNIMPPCVLSPTDTTRRSVYGGWILRNDGKGAILLLQLIATD